MDHCRITEVPCHERYSAGVGRVKCCGMSATVLVLEE